MIKIASDLNLLCMIPTTYDKSSRDSRKTAAQYDESTSGNY